MTNPVALSSFLAPFALLVVQALAVRQPGSNPGLVLASARFAALVSLLIALVNGAIAVFYGPLESPLLGFNGVGFSIRIDALSAIMFALVAFLGSVVLHYSRNYLDGDDRHGAFLGRLSLTITAVMLLVLSGNLLQLAAMWLLTSLALHRLLLFYPSRPGAVVAARKKFIVARMGDAALAGAVLLLAITYGTLDLGDLLERVSAASASGSQPITVHFAAALLVATAAFKSAQFPTHGWLAEVMETPTPVSALLHAGILNGGPFLIVRLAPVVLLSPGALHAMVILGGFTALFASVVMITQPTIKGVFAYSSAAHMGFMLMLSGLGMFTIAIAHLIAHSCYKAHAFLSAGSAVEVMRVSKVPGGKTAPGLLSLVVAFMAAIAAVVLTGALVGVSVFEQPVLVGVSATLAIGLAHLLTQSAGGAPSVFVIGRVVVAAIGTALSFFILEIAASNLLTGIVPRASLHDPFTLSLMTLVVAVFGLTSLLQLLLPNFASTPWGAAAYVLVRNGLYANALFDRAVGALHPIPSHIQKEVRP